MKVLLVANYPGLEQASMSRFADILFESLRANGVDVNRTSPKVILARPVFKSPFLRKWLGYVDQFVLYVPALAWAARDCDLVHICDHSNSIYLLLAFFKCPTIVTCHDVLAVKSGLGTIAGRSIGAFGRFYQRAVLKGLNRASYIVCVSHKTMAELMPLLSRGSLGVGVTLNAIGDAFSIQPKPASKTHEFSGLGKIPFFLHVGGNQWYKNRAGVIALFAALKKLIGVECRLIMVGKPLTAELTQLIQSASLENSVLSIINPGDEDLRELYLMAECLLFPSWEEGFGWPIVEAQACGCPVATTDKEPMREVGGNGAIFIDPSDPERAAIFILSQLNTNRKELVRLGRENVTRFSRSRFVEGYLETYRSLTEL